MIKGDRGVVGESPALLVPRVHRGDGGEMADLVLIMLLRLMFLFLFVFWHLCLTVSHCVLQNKTHLAVW